MADNDENALGPWSDADLAATTTTNAGIGADGGLPTEVRFRANVVKLIRTRIAQANYLTDAKEPAVFILRPLPPTDGNHIIERVPMLDNGLTTINGRIWYLGAGSSSGHFVECVCGTDDELFKLVTDSFCPDAAPTVIFDPRTQVPEVRYYHRGLHLLDEVEFLSLVTDSIDYDQMTGVVDTIYKNKMITPEAQLPAGKLWKDSVKSWPVKNAESVVQFYIAAALQGSYPAFEVRHEEHMPEGRLDIIIYSRNPLNRSQTTCHAVIELKVLRSFGSGGAAVTAQYTNDWVQSGVQQASSYGESKGATQKALFCFDMRVNDDGELCFAHVKTLAAQLNVLMRRWYLYATSKQYRDALAAAATSALA